MSMNLFFWSIIMAKPAIAKTSFATGINEKLAAVDVYGDVKPNVPVNNVKTDTTIDAKVSDAIKPADSLNKLLSDKLKIFTDPTIKQKDAIRQIQDIVANKTVFFNEAGKALLSDTLTNMGYKGNIEDVTRIIDEKPSSKDLLNILSGSNDKIKVIVDGVEHLRKIEDLDTATGVANLLGELTGNEELIKVVNLGPQLALLKTLSQAASVLRIPEIVKGVIDTLPDGEEKTALTIQSCMDAAQGGNIDHIIEVIKNPQTSGKVVLSAFPDIIKIILANIKLGDGDSSALVSTKLIGLLDAINPNWITIKRDGKDAIYMDNIAQANDTAISLLMQNEKTYLAAVVKSEYTSTLSANDTMSLFEYAPKNALSA